MQHPHHPSGGGSLFWVCTTAAPPNISLLLRKQSKNLVSISLIWTPTLLLQREREREEEWKLKMLCIHGHRTLGLKESFFVTKEQGSCPWPHFVRRKNIRQSQNIERAFLLDLSPSLSLSLSLSPKPQGMEGEDTK
jgi:hypothetical protein